MVDRASLWVCVPLSPSAGLFTLSAAILVARTDSLLGWAGLVRLPSPRGSTRSARAGSRTPRPTPDPWSGGGAEGERVGLAGWEHSGNNHLVC